MMKILVAGRGVGGGSEQISAWVTPSKGSRIRSACVCGALGDRRLAQYPAGCGFLSPVERNHRSARFLALLGSMYQGFVAIA